MGGFSLWHWLVLGLVVLLLFGRGRFSDMMGDVAKGLKSFKKGMTEEDDASPTTTKPAPMLETRTPDEIIAEHERKKAAAEDRQV